MKEKKRETYYILVRSITYAQAAARALRAAGIRAQSVKSPRNIENSGCGHAVVIHSSADEALRVLAGAGLPRFRVYQTADGRTFDLYR